MLIAGLCLLISLILPAASASASEVSGLTEEERTWLKNHRTIRVHNEMGWGPFNFHEFGQPKGYSIEFMDTVAAKLGLEVEYISGHTWSEYIQMLRDKQLDVMLNIVQTEERSQFILFTDPYVNNPPGLVVKEDNRTIRDMRDLNGRILAIPKGFFYQEILEKDFPGIELLLLNDQVDSMKAVSFGRAHATLGGIAVQNHLMRKHLINNLTVVGGLDDPRFENQLRMGIRNDWPLFQSILQKTLASFSAQEWDRLSRRWLEGGLQKTHRLHLDKEEQAFVEQNPVLRVHNEMSWPPFNFNEQGKPKGFSIDVMNLIARKAGFQVEYISGPAWGDFLTMAKERHLDVMLNIVNTADRREYLRFTRPYAYNPNVIVSKKNQKYDSIQSLRGKTVAVPRGFFYEEILARDFPELKLHLTENALDTLKAIMIGKADAALGESAVLNHLLAQHLMNNLTISGIADLGHEDLPNLRIASRSDWPVLNRILDRAIESVSRDEMERISRRWMGNENYVARPGSGLTLTYAEKVYLEKQPGITYCANPDWMPLERIASGGSHEGMVADYLRLMADRIGINLTLLPTESSAQSLEFARNRRCDIMSAAFETAEASRHMNFTRPYLRLPLVVAVQEDEIFVDGLKALKGETVGVPAGYGLQMRLQRDYPELKVLEVAGIKEGLQLVEEGRIFGLVGAIAPIGHGIRQHRFLNIKIGGRLDEDWKLAVAVRNDSPELLSMFNKATDYISEQEHTEVFQRWVGVKFEHGVDYDLIWKLVIAGSLLLLAIIAWNRKLSRLNRQLSQEVSLRQSAELELTRVNDHLNEQNRTLEVLSSTDALTGIANRLYTERHLKQALTRAEENNSRNLSVLLLDIDRFKAINDTWGHNTGDEVLLGVAALLKNTISPEALAGRWGGEEFMVILPDTEQDMAARVAEKLRATIAAEPFEDVNQVTASFGVAQYQPGIKARQLIQNADMALYQAKKSGRNCVICSEA